MLRLAVGSSETLLRSFSALNIARGASTAAINNRFTSTKKQTLLPVSVPTLHNFRGTSFFNKCKLLAILSRFLLVIL